VSSFDSEMMRLAEFPKIETVIAATGQPVRTLPLKNVKLQRA
jgi:hypothetical protein